jgi:phage shock protein E
MIDLIKQMFGLGPKVDYAEMVRNGALILDVRSKREFASGNIRGSINIPVEVLSSSLGRLKDKDITIITCCASGSRSAMARRVLISNGYTEVYNGGGWSSLQTKVE